MAVVALEGKYSGKEERAVDKELYKTKLLLKGCTKLEEVGPLEHFKNNLFY